MALKNTFRVAIYDEFLDAFAKLQRAQQKKVSRFMRKFRADPTNPSINYEQISTFRDPNMRTVRIDQTYRAVVLKPSKGNIYVLLWVDHHDKAMAWATNKRIEIHPETGSLQVLTSAPPVVVEAIPKVKTPTPPLFKTFSDADLSSVGVPEALLDAVRTIKSQEQLDQAGFSPDIYEALFFLADGESLEAVRNALGIDTSQTIDTQDFEAALDQATTQRRFALVTDDQELDAMLNAPLDKWRVFLHPSQRRMVTAHYRGPARVLGGAGTGKTVVAMHRAKYLASKVFTADDDRILFTTFTHNLAKDIQENLRTLCPPSILSRIQVVHLDKWVADFLRGQGYQYKLVYWSNPVLKKLWDQALAQSPNGFTEAFFREEWDYVVQPQGCASFEDYKKAKRSGRGVRLSRKQRRVIWPVFEEYRNLLEARGLRESVGAMRDAASLLESRRAPSGYRAILVDEAQDMSTVAFKLLRQIIPTEIPNDLFIVGDGHQRIYRRKVVLRHAGVNIVGRSKKLYINYRTTDEIRRYAVALLRNVEVDDLDGGQDTNQRYKSLVHGQPPQVHVAASFDDELKIIIEFVNASEQTQRTCLVTRTKVQLEQYQTALNTAGIDTYRLQRSKAEDRAAPGLRLATMHRVKGLEFDRLVVAGANQGDVPLDVAMKSEDGAVREDAQQRERALFYVAITRARREVLITSHGTPSPWLKTDS